jgi:hypothetical protein
MKSNLAIMGLMLTALLLQGCPKGVAIQLFNNSKEELLILTQSNGPLKWSTGSSLRFQSGENGMKAARDERDHIVPLLSVKKGTMLLNYKLSFYGTPDEYIGCSAGTTFSSGTIEYRLQLEEDGNLYLVKPGDPFPARSLEPQPTGFPIKPAR